MATPSAPNGAATTAGSRSFSRAPHSHAGDPRWPLVQRVVASREFERSPRLRSFLRFACERALASPRAALRERDIAVHVLGRRASRLAGGEDTLVRVHACRLRKRLAQYFAESGAAEPIVIEVPRHGYTPVFRERTTRSLPVAAPARRPRSTRSVILMLLAVTALAALVAARAAAPGPPARRPGSAVDRLWAQMCGGASSVAVVLADSNLSMLEEVLGRQLSLAEYQNREFALPVARKPADPAAATLLDRLMYRQFTSVADARVAARVAALDGAHGLTTEILSARDAGPQHFKSGPAVLAGPRRANPWLELFEGGLNFQAHFDEATGLASFENTAPLPGEAARYVVAWNRRGYCRVAYLPSLDGTGSVLVLSGTEMGSTEAGVELVTSAPWVERLSRRLGLDAEQPFPHFEVLLATELLSSSATTFDIVAHRVIPRPGT
jgi:hypothetical protein